MVVVVVVVVVRGTGYYKGVRESHQANAAQLGGDKVIQIGAGTHRNTDTLGLSAYLVCWSGC